MLYFCSIVHPTVMMRVSKLDPIVKYPEGKMEDYRLWLSLTEENSLHFGNLGSIILKLRKHKKNYSSTQTIEDEA